jgi:hypothetical protein
VRAALVNDWARAEGDAVMIAHRRSDVADLNARGRALRRANGELGADEVIAGSERSASATASSQPQRPPAADRQRAARDRRTR